MNRGWGVGAVLAIVVLFLTACSPSGPTPAQSNAAAQNRPAAHSLLAAAPVELPAGAELIGDRTDDLCGSLTNDRGGFDDAHVNGYECVLVRRVAVVVPGSGLSEEPVTSLGGAFAEANGYTSDETLDEDPKWHIDLSLNSGFQPIERGDTPLRLEARAWEIADITSSGGIFPLYLRNGTTVGHVGHLDEGSIANARAAHSEVGLLIVFRYRYYNSFQGPH